MSYAPYTFRWLLTAALVLSTSVAGMVPDCVVSACAAVRQSARESTVKTCCCRTARGETCGMPCCTAPNAPTPERGPAPIENNGSQARVSPLGLVWSQVCLPAEKLVRRGWDPRGDAAVRSLCDGTLQSTHVRIDA